jgi:hypothetical protein
VARKVCVNMVITHLYRNDIKATVLRVTCITIYNKQGSNDPPADITYMPAYYVTAHTNKQTPSQGKLRIKLYWKIETIVCMKNHPEAYISDARTSTGASTTSVSV